MGGGVSSRGHHWKSRILAAAPPQGVLSPSLPSLPLSWFNRFAPVDNYYVFWHALHLWLSALFHAFGMTMTANTLFCLYTSPNILEKMNQNMAEGEGGSRKVADPSHARKNQLSCHTCLQQRRESALLCLLSECLFALCLRIHSDLEDNKHSVARQCMSTGSRISDWTLIGFFFF